MLGDLADTLTMEVLQRFLSTILVPMSDQVVASTSRRLVINLLQHSIHYPDSLKKKEVFLM